MSYALKQVYKSLGTELSNSLHATTLANTNEMAYDGRYVWVTCGLNGIAIYDHWGEDSVRNISRATFAELDEINYPGVRELDLNLANVPQNKLKLVTYITVTATDIKRSTCLESQKEVGATVTSRFGVPTVQEIIYLVKTGPNYQDNIHAKVTSRSGSALNAFYIQRLGDKMYVTNTHTFSEIFEFSIATQSLIRVISVEKVFIGESLDFTSGTSYPMLSNLCAADGKLWFVGQPWGDTVPRKLWSFNPVNNAFTETPIASKPSFVRVLIANGNNGFVYTTNFTDVSVSKFNATNGAFSAKIRTNGLPQGVWAGLDKRIWVSSYAGMLTLVDWDDNGVHNDFSTETIATQLQVDPTNADYIWFINTGQKTLASELIAGITYKVDLIGTTDFTTVGGSNLVNSTFVATGPAFGSGVCSTGTGKLVKHHLISHTQFESGIGNADADYRFTNPDLVIHENFLILPGFNYLDALSATVVVKPQILVLTPNSIISWFIGRADSPDENDPQDPNVYFDHKYPYLEYGFRTVFSEMTGQSAIVGPFNYVGD